MSRKILTVLMGLLLPLFICPASVQGRKNIIIDWERGEITETVEPAKEEPDKEKKAPPADGREQVKERLRETVELQQKIIRRQRAVIEDLKKENRRLERLLLGYDKLLRQGR